MLNNKAIVDKNKLISIDNLLPIQSKDFENIKKSSKLMNENFYSFIQLDHFESKPEVEVPRYKSFFMLLIELELTNKSFYNDIKDKVNIIDDYSNEENDDIIYKEFHMKFKGKL